MSCGCNIEKNWMIFFGKENKANRILIVFINFKILNVLLPIAYFTHQLKKYPQNDFKSDLFSAFFAKAMRYSVISQLRVRFGYDLL